MKISILALENGGFAIERTNEKTGKVADIEKFEGEKTLDSDKVAAIIGQSVKRHGDVRRACLSLLGAVLADRRMDAWRMKGDVKSGKMVKEVKASLRDAESDHIKSLQKALKLKDEQAIQEFLSTLRADKNYEAVKGVSLRYWFFVGKSPVTDAGYLVPVPVMVAEINNALQVPETDTSIAGKLFALSAEVNGRTEKTVLVSAQHGFVDAIASLKLMLATFEGLKREEDEKMTAKRMGPPTKDASTATMKAIDTAKQDAPALV